MVKSFGTLIAAVDASRRPGERPVATAGAAPAAGIPANMNPHFAPAFFRTAEAGGRCSLLFSEADRLYWEFDEKFVDAQSPALRRLRGDDRSARDQVGQPRAHLRALAGGDAGAPAPLARDPVRAVHDQRPPPARHRSHRRPRQDDHRDGLRAPIAPRSRRRSALFQVAGEPPSTYHQTALRPAAARSFPCPLGASLRSAAGDDAARHRQAARHPLVHSHDYRVRSPDLGAAPHPSACR